MANDVQRISDMLSAPMEAVLIALGVGVAKAQQAMDQNALEMQREIDEDPVLSDVGVTATWYQIPKAEIELNIAIAMEEKKAGNPAPALGKIPKVLQAYPLKQLYIQPVNASYTNQFSYDVQAASKLKFSIVPVPPPAAEAAVTAKLSGEKATDLAWPFLVTKEITQPEGSKKTILQEDTRLAVNFNGQARLWFVLQSQVLADETKRLALVVVDDDTSQVVKHEKGG